MCISSQTTAAQGSEESPQQIDISTTHLPDVVKANEICVAAWNLACANLEPSILNHSARVFLHAQRLADRAMGQSSWTSKERIHLLFTACILHDIGTCHRFDGPQRFEVEGADAATQLLEEHGVSKADAHDVWAAIALHTSAGIAERIGELPCLIRKAVLIDFGKSDADTDVAEAKKLFEQRWPRFDVEKRLGDAVVAQAFRHPEKAPPASWPGILYRSAQENLSWNGINKAF